MLAAAFLLGRPGPALAEDAPAPARVAAVQAFERATSMLRAAWPALERATAGQQDAVEAARKQARALERAAPAAASRRWRQVWAGTEKSRASLHARSGRRVAHWLKALRALLGTRPLPLARRTAVADVCFDVLERRLRREEAGDVLAAVTAAPAAWATALGWSADAARRRATLALLADRLAATPGVSDLDVLVEVVRWEAVFLRARTAGTPALEDLSTDLILLFTERGADGISRSKAGFHHARRLTDRGFHADLRDGSDQVRHVSWALRMFARSTNADATEALLRMKEHLDAARRKVPLDKADLALNAAARRLVRDLRPGAGGDLRPGTGTPASGEKVRPPLPPAKWAARFRAVLGGGAR